MNYRELSKEAFCLGLRFYGIALIFQGIRFIHDFVTSLLQHFTVDTLLLYFYRGLYAVPAVLIGIWFLRGAPKLLSFCYHNKIQKVD